MNYDRCVIRFSTGLAVATLLALLALCCVATCGCGAVAGPSPEAEQSAVAVRAKLDEITADGLVTDAEARAYVELVEADWIVQRDAIAGDGAARWAELGGAVVASIVASLLGTRVLRGPAQPRK